MKNFTEQLDELRKRLHGRFVTGKQFWMVFFYEAEKLHKQWASGRAEWLKAERHKIRKIEGCLCNHDGVFHPVEGCPIHGQLAWKEDKAIDQAFELGEKEAWICEVEGCNKHIYTGHYCQQHSIKNPTQGKVECKCEDKNTDYHLLHCMKFEDQKIYNICQHITCDTPTDGEKFCIIHKPIKSTQEFCSCPIQINIDLKYCPECGYPHKPTPRALPEKFCDTDYQIAKGASFLPLMYKIDDLLDYLANNKGER